MSKFSHTTTQLVLAGPYSKKTLYRLKNTEKIFVPGQHFISVGVGKKRPTLMWDLKAVEELFQRRTRKLFK